MKENIIKICIKHTIIIISKEIWTISEIRIKLIFKILKMIIIIIIKKNKKWQTYHKVNLIQ